MHGIDHCLVSFVKWRYDDNPFTILRKKRGKPFNNRTQPSQGRITIFKRTKDYLSLRIVIPVFRLAKDTDFLLGKKCMVRYP
jgi:hypothetical protein